MAHTAETVHNPTIDRNFDNLTALHGIYRAFSTLDASEGTLNRFRLEFAKFHLEPFVSPPDEVIEVTPNSAGRDTPLDIQEADETGRWSYIDRSSQRYEEFVTRDKFAEAVFRGNTLVLDQETKRFFVYNEVLRARIELTPFTKVVRQSIATE